MFRCDHNQKRACVSLLKFQRNFSRLPDDGDHTETCWRYCNFNVNFDTTLKTILLCIGNKETLIIEGCTVKVNQSRYSPGVPQRIPGS